MSPCVTWRGDDQFKVMKAKLQEPPGGVRPARAGPPPSPYMRETDALTTGVLYEVQQASFVSRLTDLKVRAQAGRTGPVTTDEVLRSFMPAF